MAGGLLDDPRVRSFRGVSIFRWTDEFPCELFSVVLILEHSLQFTRFITSLVWLKRKLIPA